MKITVQTIVDTSEGLPELHLIFSCPGLSMKFLLSICLNFDFCDLHDFPEASAKIKGIRRKSQFRQKSTPPKAYLNYILFDQQYKVLDAGWQRVPTSANFSRQKVTLPAKYIAEAGYYFTYLTLSAGAFREGGAMREKATITCISTTTRCGT